MSKEKYSSLIEKVYEHQQKADSNGKTKEELYDIINKLIKMSRNNVFKGYKLSPITIEIAMRNCDEVQKLLENGTDVNEVNLSGMTPLHTAIFFNNTELVKLILDYNANVNFLCNGLSPIMLACDMGNDKILKALIDKGAYINEVDDNGYNTLQHVVNSGTAIALDWGSMVTDLQFLFQGRVIKLEDPTKACLNCVDLLINAGVDVNFCNENNGITALAIALEGIGSRYTKIVEKLIQYGSSKKVIEISPSRIYTYQDSFDFLYDIRDLDFSCWIDAPKEFLDYLEYRRRIVKFGIEVYSKNLEDGYRRSKRLINPLR